MHTYLRIAVVSAVGWLLIQVLLLGVRGGAQAVGKPPISRTAFFLAKLALGSSFVLLVLSAVFRPPVLSAFSTIAVIGLLFAGTVVFTAAIFGLGANLRMGLPQEETVLITSGMYRFSRNPIYVGIYLLLAASLVYAFSWLNAVSAAVAVLLHHWIIRAEERYLGGRFSEYDAYCRKVRRYL